MSHRLAWPLSLALLLAGCGGTTSGGPDASADSGAEQVLRLEPIAALPAATSGLRPFGGEASGERIAFLLESSSGRVVLYESDGTAARTAPRFASDEPITRSYRFDGADYFHTAPLAGGEAMRYRLDSTGQPVALGPDRPALALVDPGALYLIDRRLDPRQIEILRRLPGSSSDALIGMIPGSLEVVLGPLLHAGRLYLVVASPTATRASLYEIAALETATPVLRRVARLPAVPIEMQSSAAGLFLAYADAPIELLGADGTLLQPFPAGFVPRHPLADGALAEFSGATYAALTDTAEGTVGLFRIATTTEWLALDGTPGPWSDLRLQANARGLYLIERSYPDDPEGASLAPTRSRLLRLDAGADVPLELAQRVGADLGAALTLTSDGAYLLAPAGEGRLDYYAAGDQALSRAIDGLPAEVLLQPIGEALYLWDGIEASLLRVIAGRIEARYRLDQVPPALAGDEGVALSRVGDRLLVIARTPNGPALYALREPSGR